MHYPFQYNLSVHRTWLRGLIILACVMPGTLAAAGHAPLVRPVIEVLDSSQVHLSALYLRERDGRLTLRGRASRLLPQRGFIPGAVRITLHNAAGDTLATRTVRPMRANRQAHFGQFYVELPRSAALPEHSLIRVAAVPLGSASQWQF